MRSSGSFSRTARRPARRWEPSCPESKLKSIASRGCREPAAAVEGDMHFREISTPALAIDLDVLERNLDRMAASCREQGVGLRPHTKTHKTPEVSRMQLERGAVGLTVAKVGEAEVMVAAGLDEILLSYPVFGPGKLRRLARLPKERRNLLSVGDGTTAQTLSPGPHRQGGPIRG